MLENQGATPTSESRSCDLLNRDRVFRYLTPRRTAHCCGQPLQATIHQGEAKSIDPVGVLLHFMKQVSCCRFVNSNELLRTSQSNFTVVMIDVRSHDNVKFVTNSSNPFSRFDLIQNSETAVGMFPPPTRIARPSRLNVIDCGSPSGKGKTPTVHCL